jgi:hypothetical protein
MIQRKKYFDKPVNASMGSGSHSSSRRAWLDRIVAPLSAIIKRKHATFFKNI